MTTIIETERLILRTWQDSDEQPFYQMNQDQKVIEFLRGPLRPEDARDFRIRMQKQYEERGYTLYAIQPKDGTADFIGFVGLNYTDFEAPFTPAIEIGWRLASAYWGKGYATEAAKAVLKYAFEVLKIDEIVSFTVPMNKSSVRVMEKIGLKRDFTGDFNHWRYTKNHPMSLHVLYRLTMHQYHQDERSLGS